MIGAVHPKTFPLGIDLGEARVRVALVHHVPGGRNEIVAVASRDYGDDPPRALSEAVAELRTRERRCVFGLGEPRALVRSMRFPPMKRAEQERAARFEATQLVDYPIDEAAVRIVDLGTDGATAVGVVRKDAIAKLVSIAHGVKLRVTAIDNNAFALQRALRGADAVLDVGLRDSRLYVYAGRVPVSRRFPIGGADFTAAIAKALGCDEATAVRRKHAHGIAGSGEAIVDSLIGDVANALIECRVEGIADVREIVLAGNGARLTELPALLERATAVRVHMAEFGPEQGGALPPDVLRAAAPDWCLAYGLALWSAQ